MSLNMRTRLLGLNCAGDADQNLLGDLGLDFALDDLEDLDGLMMAPPAAKKPTQKTETKSGAPMRCCHSQHKVSQFTDQHCTVAETRAERPRTATSNILMVRLVECSAAGWQGSMLAAGR
jgi:hypothetical protein